ncbi:INO80 complex subunit D-like isoform X2 [Haliotis cracherodii]|uniref:INO80 complex subunit D-like isoform X2 n=1 Tax=Haliotis cracherodii TaxID=6455 RepID=UPI0039EC910C
MCLSLHAMYEGKNIHYSAVDNKPLCSFSAKLCNQRRLNGYAFCVRHILEDPTAPFKRCAYVAKSSNQMCTQPIPKHEERLYCNNHMQVLGMLPRKERKPKKEKEVNVVHHDNRLSFEDRVKSKYITKIKNDVSTKQLSMDDPDDPYAFPDPVRDTPVVNNVNPQPSQILEVPKQPQPSPNRAKSPGDGGSTIAKLYPELAEKLEKIKPKVEPKVKGRIRSSRTMNKLQTKIAQNKIKDKLRKSQESGSNPSVSPVSLPSPDPTPVASQPPVNLNTGQQVNPPPLMRLEGAPHPPLKPPITHHALPTNTVGLSEVNYSVSALAARLSPQILPPPYPGPTNRLPAPPPPPPPAMLPIPTVVQQQPAPAPVPIPVPVSVPVPVPVPIPVPVPVPVPVPQTSTVMPPAPIPEPRLPPPPPYVAPPRPPTVSMNSSVPVLSTKPQRLKDVIVEKVERTKLKTNSAMNFYACYAKRKKYNHHLVSSGLCSSSEDDSDDENVEMLPWQPGWFSASSDDDNEEEQMGELPIHVRATKLTLLRAKLRRQCYQSRKATCTNTSLQTYDNEATLALIKSARDSPVSTVKTLWEILKIPQKQADRYKRRGLDRRPCLYRNDEDDKCLQRALPYTNHCLKHIMYNVDQQLFDYCTAKFADNTQCCVPVFDIRHGLPLCTEHGAKVDNHQKSGDIDIKKRPRKKTKPPALTRPPKKGKKKKKNRYIRPQKPIPPAEPTGDPGAFAVVAAAVMAASEKEEEDSSDGEKDEEHSASTSTSMDHSITESSSSGPAQVAEKMETEDSEEAQKNDEDKEEDEEEEEEEDDEEDKEEMEPEGALSNVPLEEMLPASGRIEDIDKTFELPLEQASRLLEEQDFQDVFNKIPDEAFDIFSGKNGDFVPTLQETEELERALAAATKDVYSAKDTLEKLVKGEITDELSLQTIAETILAHGMQNNAVEASFAGESVPPDLLQEGLYALSRNLTTGGNAGFTPSTTVSANNAILSRLQAGVSYSQNQSVTVPFNGAVTSGNSSGAGQSTNISQLAPGFQNTTVSAQNIGTTLPNRTTMAPQRGFQNSQGVAHAGYHGNLPYSALSQQLAMSQQTPKGQAIASPSSVGQLHIDSSHVLPHSNLPQQQPIHSQPIIPSQLSGARPPWPQAAVSSTNVNYQNGFPGPVAQAPFIQTVNIANPVGKFPTSAQANMTDFANKQDPHFVATLPHSRGVPAIRPPVQGFGFTSGMPPFTSSSNGS